jgi:hypothetical protein
MTTISLQVNESEQDFIEAMKKLIAQFGPSITHFKISPEIHKQEVLDNLAQVCKDIKSGEAFKTARPIEELYKELEND